MAYVFKGSSIASRPSQQVEMRSGKTEQDWYMISLTHYFQISSGYCLQILRTKVGLENHQSNLTIFVT